MVEPGICGDLRCVLGARPSWFFGGVLAFVPALFDNFPESVLFLTCILVVAAPGAVLSNSPDANAAALCDLMSMDDDTTSMLDISVMEDPTAQSPGMATGR